MTFHDLPYKEYKRKAESMDQDMRERKLGPYSRKKASSDAPTKSTLQHTTNKAVTKSSEQKQSKQKLKTNMKDRPSKNQIRKDRLYFNQGHITNDCTQNVKLENNRFKLS